MKRHIFSLILIIITSLRAYTQEETTLMLDKQQETSMQSYEFISENETISSNVIYSFSTPNAPMSTKHLMNKALDYKNTSEWKNYKILSAVGWSALGVGVPMTLTGMLGIALSSINGGNGGPLIIITAVGGGLTISSIPLLITAYHYRNKAKKLYLNVGATAINKQGFSNQTDYTPALSLTLNF